VLSFGLVFFRCLPLPRKFFCQRPCTVPYSRIFQWERFLLNFLTKRNSNSLKQNKGLFTFTLERYPYMKKFFLVISVFLFRCLCRDIRKNKRFLVGNTKITFQTIKANFVYEVLRSIRRILLLEIAVKAKMLTFVLTTEKRILHFFIKTIL